MKIVIDPTERREGSLLPLDIKAEIFPGLEALTGADLMLCNASFPTTTETLILKHIEQGALLIQRKSGMDLVNSLGLRMADSLARMRSTKARQSQCILLIIGILTCDAAGRAVMDGRETSANYWAVQGAVSKWHDRGGVVEILSRAGLLQGYLESKTRHLEEYRVTPVKQYFPEPQSMHQSDNPLQLPQLVTDGRVTLASLPGIGAGRANQIWDACNQNLSEALCRLTTEGAKIPGVGDVTLEKIREYMGLDPTMELTLEVSPIRVQQLEDAKLPV